MARDRCNPNTAFNKPCLSGTGLRKCFCTGTIWPLHNWEKFIGKFLKIKSNPHFYICSGQNGATAWLSICTRWLFQSMCTMPTSIPEIKRWHCFVDHRNDVFFIDTLAPFGHLIIAKVRVQLTFRKIGGQFFLKILVTDFPPNNLVVNSHSENLVPNFSKMADCNLNLELFFMDFRMEIELWNNAADHICKIWKLAHLDAGIKNLNTFYRFNQKAEYICIWTLAYRTREDFFSLP